MTQKKIVISISIALVAVLAFYVFDALFSEQATEFNEPDQLSFEPTIQEREQKVSSQDANNAEQEEAEEFLKEQLGDQLEWVVQAFEQQAIYPAYSVLITDIELAMPPAPFEEAKVEMNTFSPNGDLLPISIAASVEKLNYVVGEPITVQLQIIGADANPNVFATVNIKQNQGSNLLFEDLNMIAVSASQTEFRATANSEDIRLKGSSQELIARIEVELDGQQYVTTVPFYLSKASAMIEGVGRAEQIKDHLVIPLEFDVYESGYYFVSAYLDDAKTNRPLLALQSEGRLSKGSDELALKAHQQALKDAGSEGPYKLRISSSFRGAEDDEVADVQTGVSESAYDIPDFSFDGYADTPFSDPLVDEQLKALKELSGKG